MGTYARSDPSFYDLAHVFEVLLASCQRVEAEWTGASTWKSDI